MQGEKSVASRAMDSVPSIFVKRPLSDRQRASLRTQVAAVVERTPVYDIHTHLYDPALSSLLLWGIDDLLVYHYLVSETFRYLDVSPEQFWAMPKTRQASLVWDQLFLKHSPVSEACRGVITVLNALGISPRKRDLNALRKWFASLRMEDYVTRCMEAANVSKICMTNSPFDDVERPFWQHGFQRDERFTSALRIDPLLLDWPVASRQLTQWGYGVSASLNAKTIAGVRHFLEDWTHLLNAQYLMVSLPPEFQFPSKSHCSQLITQAVLPHCEEHNLPFALMMGVKRAVNPQLRLSGDGVGWSDMSALEHLCCAFPRNRFLCTALSREVQHTLCVIARKFPNLHPFGCWWFTNIPLCIDEITRLRLELLGLSFTPQHSDARVLDQIIYKWRHSREIISRALAQKYVDLADSGWLATPAEIERDVADLFGGAFERFCTGKTA